MTEADWPSSAAGRERTGAMALKLKLEQGRERSAGTAESNGAYVATSLSKSKSGGKKPLKAWAKYSVFWIRALGYAR
jgi:hypothetical protein